MEYELFVDESGQFLETSSNAREQAQSQQGFASQIAGFVALRGAVTESRAADLLKEAHEYAGLPWTGAEKGSHTGLGYDKLIQHLAERLPKQGIRPVRLVNEERVSYGDRVATYTSLLAELALRVLSALAPNREDQATLFIRAAIVKTGQMAANVPVLIQKPDYIKRIQQAFGFAAVRQGVGAAHARLKLGDFDLLSARQDARLQICDFISNASHADFKRCNQATRDSLQKAFGPFDVKLTQQEGIVRADDLLRESSFGMAAVVLCERLVERGIEPNVRAMGAKRVERIVEGLARLSPRARDIQLTIVQGWLEQIVEQERNLDLGLRALGWVQASLHSNLEKRLKGTEPTAVAWFAYALYTLQMAARNHKGQLHDGRLACDAMDKLAPVIAPQFEHTPLLIGGMVVQSVHFTDCWEFEKVAARCSKVSTYLRDVATLVPGEVRRRSPLYGKTLGTWMQAETILAISDPTRYARARELSDEAIEVFESPADKERQYQYRCQLETCAGEVETALGYLARSLQTDPTHQAVTSAIAQKQGFEQGFGLLHWLRLAIETYKTRPVVEMKPILEAFNSAKLLELGWSKGEITDYPAHGILRRIAGLAIIGGAIDVGRKRLEYLRKMFAAQEAALATNLVVVAAHLECAGVLWDTNPAAAQELLQAKSPKAPHADLISATEEKCGPEFTEVRSRLREWRSVVRDCGSASRSGDAGKRLLKISKGVVY